MNPRCSIMALPRVATYLVAAFLFFLTRAASAQERTLHAQLAEPFTPDTLAHVVDTVLVKGNKVTESSIILREMSLRRDSLITIEKLRYNQERIYSLGLFTQVDLLYDKTKVRTPLIVSVRERWYIFPVPIIGLEDRDWKKLYYGLGFLHDNFRGKNEKLWLGFALGYDPWVEITYKNPWMNRSNLFSEFELEYSVQKNKSLIAQGAGSNFDQHLFSGSILIGKRFGLFTSLGVRLEYLRVSVTQPSAGRTISPSGIDNLISATIGGSYDTRDLKEYASEGTFISASGTYGRFLENTSTDNAISSHLWVGQVSGDARHYQRLSPALTLAGRAFGALTAGNAVPPYRHVFFGYKERIRGYFYKVLEGENLFGSSVELRLKLLQPHYIHVEEIPIPQFDTWRIAMDISLFSDIGTVWFRNEQFLTKRFFLGYGAGIHLELPYSIILRLEYALNQSMKGEFIFDVGASF
ncbi:MAG: POTRA domain-containing protein [Bacteroidota bacterium]